MYGVHHSHVTSKTRMNNMLPVNVARPQLAQLGSHSANAHLGVPFVSHDAAVGDPRLAAWCVGLDDVLFDVARSLPPLPVARVVLIATPNTVGASSVLDDQAGCLPSFAVWRYGRLTEQVAKAFQQHYEGVRVYPEHLVFVCDFFAVPSVSDGRLLCWFSHLQR
jgi:hypothetical protein